MLLMDLNVDCVDAFLNVIPGEKLFAAGKSLHSLFDKSVSIPAGECHEEFNAVSQHYVNSSAHSSAGIVTVEINSEVQSHATERHYFYNLKFFNLIYFLLLKLNHTKRTTMYDLGSISITAIATIKQ